MWSVPTEPPIKGTIRAFPQCVGPSTGGRGSSPVPPRVYIAQGCSVFKDALRSFMADGLRLMTGRAYQVSSTASLPDGAIAGGTTADPHLTTAVGRWTGSHSRTGLSTE